MALSELLRLQQKRNKMLLNIIRLSSLAAMLMLTACAGKQQMIQKKMNYETKIVKPSVNTPRVYAKYIQNPDAALNMIGKDLWAKAEPVSFNTRCSDGIPEGPQTQIRFLWSDKKVFFHVEAEKNSFACKNTSDKLWNGSNIEFLFTPEWLAEPCKDEYEFLFNSDGNSNTLHWTGKGLEAAFEWETRGLKWQLNEIKFSSGNTWNFAGEIPFSDLNTNTPLPGAYWGLGLFRKITPVNGNDIMQAWSPTLENPPRFHRPEKFGMLIFKKNQ